MLPISDGKRDVYGLDTLQVMGAAFDTAVQLLPPNLKDHERTRRNSRCSSFTTLTGESLQGSWQLAVLDFLRATQ